MNFLRSAADPSFVAPAAAADAGWEGDKGNVLHSSVRSPARSHPGHLAARPPRWRGTAEPCRG